MDRDEFLQKLARPSFVYRMAQKLVEGPTREASVIQGAIKRMEKAGKEIDDLIREYIKDFKEEMDKV